VPISFPKVRGAPRAVGATWVDPAKLVECLGVGDQIRASLQDELLANKQPTFLWLPLTSGAACSCRRTNDENDLLCLTCAGTNVVGGYRRFLTQNFVWASSDASTYTVTDGALDTSIKPHRVAAAGTALTTVITTTAVAFTNPRDDRYEFLLVAQRRAAGQTIGLEYRVDGGPWSALAAVYNQRFGGWTGIIDDVARPIGTGTLQFRITMTRPSAAPELPPPVFEILRVRRVETEFIAPMFAPHTPRGEILALNNWDEEVTRGTPRGLVTTDPGVQFKTAPLDAFDIRIVKESVAAALDNRTSRAAIFVEQARPIRAGLRFALTQISLANDIGSVFTHQVAAGRRIDIDDPIHRVW
jgi:hypothetical protein